MANVRGKDKGKRKKRPQLTTDQKVERQKKIAASNNAKAKKNRVDNTKKSNGAQRKFIQSMGGKKSEVTTKNMHADSASKAQENEYDGQASGNAVDNLKTPEDHNKPSKTPDLQMKCLLS